MLLLCSPSISYSCDLTDIIEAQPSQLSGSIDETVRCGNPLIDKSAVQVIYNGNLITTTWTYKQEQKMWIVLSIVDVPSGAFIASLMYQDMSCIGTGKERDTVVFVQKKVISNVSMSWDKDVVMNISFSTADSTCLNNISLVPHEVKLRLLRSKQDALLLRERINKQI